MTDQRTAETNRASMFRALAIDRLDATYALAAHLLGDPAEAEDACREMLRRAWQAWPGFTDPQRFAPWFDRILLDGCTMRLRARMQEARAAGRGGPGDADPIHAALAHLSVEERVVVVLRRAVAFGPEAIAERTGLSADRVRSFLGQADRHLADRLHADRDTPSPEPPAADLEAQVTSWFADHRQPWAPYGLRRAVEDIVTGDRLPSAQQHQRWRWPGLAAAVILVAASLAAWRMLMQTAAPLPSQEARASGGPSATAPSQPASAAPTGRLVPLAGWSERVIDEDTPGIQVLGWSSDGSKFAVIGGHDVTTSTAQVFDRSGTLLRTFPAQLAGWADAGHLIAMTPAPNNASGDALQAAEIWVRSATGTDDRRLDVAQDDTIVPLGGGVAVAGPVGSVDLNNPTAETFQLYHAGGLTGVITGYPLAWSADARVVAYAANLRSVGSLARGSLRVLDLSTMRSRGLGWDVDLPGLAWLSPDGGSLMACIVAAQSSDRCAMALIDTLSLQVLSQSSVDATRATWTAGGDVVLSSGGSLEVWPPNSTPAAAAWQPAPGSGVEGISSAGGWTVAFVANGPDSPQTIAGAPGVAVVSVGPFAPHLLMNGAVSADGSRVIYTRRTPDGSVDQLVLATLPPPVSTPLTPLPVPSAQPTASLYLAGAASDGSLWAIQGRNWLISTNAGKTWQRHDLPQPASQVLTAAALDPDHAWLVTIGAGSTAVSGGPNDLLEYRVWRTSDGGTNWRSDLITTNFAGHTPKLLLLDAQRGYLLAAEERVSDGLSTVLRTTDGGTTWEAAGSVPRLGSMFAASDSETLWAGAQPEAGGVGHPLLEVSRDGGDTWTEVALPGIEPDMVGQPVLAGPPTFLDGRNGLLALIENTSDGSSLTRVYRTTDAGHTWTELAGFTGEATAGPVLLDRTDWFLPVGNPLGLMATTDSGSGWEPISTTGLINGGWIVWMAPITGSQLAATIPIGSSYPGEVALFVSADGGRAWQSVP